jgi:ankyrin repeat protein
MPSVSGSGLVVRGPAVSPTLSSHIASQVANFIDKFESDKSYPPALLALQHKPSIKKKRTNRRQAQVENEQPHKMRHTRLHLAVLQDNRRWLRFVCREALDKELIEADIYGKTPLHYAAERELLNELVAHRTSIVSFLQIADAEGDTPLHTMAKSKRFDRSVIAHLRASELKLLLQIRNSQELNILDIIKNNGDNRLLEYLNTRCEKNN